MLRRELVFLREWRASLSRLESLFRRSPTTEYIVQAQQLPSECIEPYMFSDLCRRVYGTACRTGAPHVTCVHSNAVPELPTTWYSDEVIEGANLLPENSDSNLDSLLWPEADPAMYTKTFDIVCLGGTFDHIHYGHKMLLTEAVALCSRLLIVGVTDESMLKSKSLSILIEPIEERIETVRQFLELVRPELTYDVVPISDPFGPSITFPGHGCLVVSAETRRGGEAVNEKRIKADLPAAHLHILEVLDCPGDTNDMLESKISSSNVRFQLLGTAIREPLRVRSPNKPYIIGLTGTIGSGKSSIARRLGDLGARVIDCDARGHQAYAPGSSCNEALVSEFGSSILNDDGTINRKALGSIVFGSDSALNRLQEIVWPLISNIVEEEISSIPSTAVVVLDAAVLLEAGWQELCDEVWLCYVPEAESVKRVIARDSVDEEAARARIRRQLPASEKVKSATVVLSTLWEYDVTQRQVEKAWRLLGERAGGLHMSPRSGNL